MRVGVRDCKNLVGLVACFCCLVSGVVASERKPLDVILPANHGYLLFGLRSDAIINEIEISGRKKISYKPASYSSDRQYALLPVPSGKYSFTNVDSEVRKYSIKKLKKNSYYEDASWSFYIDAGVINYVGDLEFVIHNYLYDIELVNYSSYAMQYILESYKGGMRFPMKYSGPGNDSFLQFQSARLMEE